jgi:hypothetical protein
MRAFLFVLGALMAVGCSAGSSAPAAPTPTPPTANSIAITSGTDALRTGFFADFTITATMSDRTTQMVTSQAALTTSDASIATIDTSGRLTAIRHGVVTINASYQGRTTSRAVSIVFNYAGTWTGTFAVRACDQTGIFLTSRYCQNAQTEPLPLALELTQTGTNVDRISGSISLRNLVGPVTGEVTGDGRLVLSGAYVATTGGFNLRVEILSWATNPVQTTGMSGFFVYKVEVVGSDGVANQTNEIISVSRKLENPSR